MSAESCLLQAACHCPRKKVIWSSSKGVVEEDGEKGKRVQEIYHFWNSCVANRCMSLNWQPFLVFAHLVKTFVAAGFVAAELEAAAKDITTI